MIELEPDELTELNSTKSDDDLLDSEQILLASSDVTHRNEELLGTDSDSDDELLSAAEMFSKLKLKQDKSATNCSNCDKGGIRGWGVEGSYLSNVRDIEIRKTSSVITESKPNEAVEGVIIGEDRHLCNVIQGLEKSINPNPLPSEKSFSMEKSREECYKLDNRSRVIGGLHGDMVDKVKNRNRDQSYEAYCDNEGYTGTSQADVKWLPIVNTEGRDLSLTTAQSGIKCSQISKTQLSASADITIPELKGFTDTSDDPITDCDDGNNADDDSLEKRVIRQFPTGAESVFYRAPEIWKLNLDITTLISYVSNLTHGLCHYVFVEPILSQQAAEEREKALLPELEELFQGKENEIIVIDFCGVVSKINIMRILM